VKDIINIERYQLLVILALGFASGALFIGFMAVDDAGVRAVAVIPGAMFIGAGWDIIKGGTDRTYRKDTQTKGDWVVMDMVEVIATIDWDCAYCGARNHGPNTLLDKGFKDGDRRYKSDQILCEKCGEDNLVVEYLD